MENKLWELMSELLRLGFTSEDISMVENKASSREWFGTKCDIELKGKWVAVYVEDDAYCDINIEPTIKSTFYDIDTNYKLYLYQID